MYSNKVSLKCNIIDDPDYSKALEGIRSLYSQLEYLHNNDFYVSNLNADSIVYENYYGFKEISKLPKDGGEELIIKNVKDLVKLSLGVFVSLHMDGNIFYDYTKLDDSFIVDNYLDGIRPSIRYGVSYFDNIVNSKLFNGYGRIDTLYLNKALENTGDKSRSEGVAKVKLLNNGSGSGNGNGELTRETPAVVFVEEAAFIKVFFYPIIVGSILICAFIVYLLYTYL